MPHRSDARPSAILSLLERLASGGPVVLALDDLQWVDAPSVVALRSIARRLRNLPVGMICAYCPSPRSGELALFVQAQLALGAVHLALARLGEEEVRAVAAP